MTQKPGVSPAENLGARAQRDAERAANYTAPAPGYYTV